MQASCIFCSTDWRGKMKPAHWKPTYMIRRTRKRNRLLPLVQRMSAMNEAWIFYMRISLRLEQKKIVGKLSENWKIFAWMNPRQVSVANALIDRCNPTMVRSLRMTIDQTDRNLLWFYYRTYKSYSKKPSDVGTIFYGPYCQNAAERKLQGTKCNYNSVQFLCIDSQHGAGRLI